MQYCQLCKHYGMVHLSAYFGALEESEPNNSFIALTPLTKCRIYTIELNLISDDIII